MPWLVAMTLTWRVADRRTRELVAGRRHQLRSNKKAEIPLGSWVLLISAVGVFVLLGVVPRLAAWIGLAATATLALGSMAGMLSAIALLIQDRPTAEVFRLFRLRRSPAGHPAGPQPGPGQPVRRAGQHPRGRPRCPGGLGGRHPADHGRLVRRLARLAPSRARPRSAAGQVRPMLLIAAEGGGIRAAYWTVRGPAGDRRHHLRRALGAVLRRGQRRVGRADRGPVQRYAGRAQRRRGGRRGQADGRAGHPVPGGRRHLRPRPGLRRQRRAGAALRRARPVHLEGPGPADRGRLGRRPRRRGAGLGRPGLPHPDRPAVPRDRPADLELLRREARLPGLGQPGEPRAAGDRDRRPELRPRAAAATSHRVPAPGPSTCSPRTGRSFPVPTRRPAWAGSARPPRRC